MTFNNYKTILQGDNVKRDYDDMQNRVKNTKNAKNDFKVADLSLAELGRKRITMAEHEMPGSNDAS